MPTTATYPFRALAPLQRSWLFVPGGSETAHDDALRTDCDVVVADLEEMTAPDDRPAARLAIVSLIAKAHGCGAYAAVRINKLEHDGLQDLAGIMVGRPDAVFLPHTETVDQLAALDTELHRLESKYDIPVGSTTVVPTIESARGLLALGKLLTASPRVRACMLAVEDLAASLGARRTPEGNELLYARSRFLLEVRATDCLAIDLPCTYRSPEILAHDLGIATNLGFNAKCAVFTDQVGAIHRAFTPSTDEFECAQALVLRRKALLRGSCDTSLPWVDAPDANNAERTIQRHTLCQNARKSATD